METFVDGYEAIWLAIRLLGISRTPLLKTPSIIIIMIMGLIYSISNPPTLSERSSVEFFMIPLPAARLKSIPSRNRLR